jgi:hydrogenase-4 component F
MFIATLLLVIAGFSRVVLSLSFGPVQEELQIPEQPLRILPSFALLLTSLVLCLWMPEPMYRLITNAIAVIGGTIHG